MTNDTPSNRDGDAGSGGKSDGRGGGPLSGLRVLDATTTLGRYAGKLMAEMGADVLRVLPGERGPDLTGPDDPGLLDLWHDNSCTLAPLDLDSERGAGRFRELAAVADIVIEAEGPGVMVGRGLGPDELAAENRSLVQVSLSPQGADGPRAEWRSSDLVAQSLAGYLSVTGDPDNPVALWGRQAGTVTGFFAVVSALAGLHRARATGRGSRIDLSQHQALVSCSEHLLMYWWHREMLEPLGAPIASRQRSLHWVRAFEVVPCKRGACMVSPAAGGLVDLIAWLKARGHAQEVPDDPEVGELLSLIQPMMDALKAAALETDATELFEAGQSLHVPFGESYTVPQVAGCEQHLARGFFRPAAEAAPPALGSAPAIGGEVRLPGPLARFGATPVGGWAWPETVSSDEVLARWSTSGSGADGSSIDAPTTVDDPQDDRPLAGLRVLDFSHVMAGPFATRILADLGAEVIRVQTDERSAGSAANDYPYNIMWARSKRSIQLQMKHERAMEVMRPLVEQADIVIDNFSAGVMASWGAGPEQLAEWNPRVISISMTGCGVDGPWADKVTYAPTIHALCGLTALTGPKGELDCGPGIAFNDHVSGLAGATSLLAALATRDATGRGQHIDLSQLEVGTYLIGPAVVDWMVNGREASSNGNVDPFADHPVNDVFLCADGDWLAVTAFDDDDLARLSSIDGIGPDLVEAGRAENEIRRWAAGVGGSAAQAALQAAGVAAGLVQNARHLTEQDEQLAHRDWLVEVDSSILGRQTTDRHPGQWFSVGGDGTSKPIELRYSGSPYLGEHNFEVYEELLGWDAEQIAIAIGEELIL